MIDDINSLFLCGEIVFLSIALRKLFKAKCSIAISLSLNLFFMTWQGFSIFFYWHLGQMISAWISVVVFGLLVVYSAGIHKFSRRSGDGLSFNEIESK